jgi:hypothetical protein
MTLAGVALYAAVLTAIGRALRGHWLPLSVVASLAAIASIVVVAVAGR